MKKLISTISILVMALSVMSQNWQPINPEYVYFYKTANDEFISNTVLVDSVAEISNIEIYYLNHKMQFCDTCENINCFEPWGDFYISDYPNFLQKEIHLINDHKTIFKNSQNFAILHKAGINQEWLFDTTNNITASISKITFEEVFPSVFDSVKYISLTTFNNTAKLIKLAKDYGILKFPGIYLNDQIFYLQGGRTPDYEFGEEVLDFWDLFDYEVGDIMCYYDYEVYQFDKPPPSEYKVLKRTILNKEIFPNKIEYYQEIKTKSWTDDANSPSYSINYNTLIIENTPDKLYNTLPGMTTNDETPHNASLRLNNFDSTLSLCLSRQLVKCGNYDNIYYDEQGYVTIYYAKGLGTITKNSMYEPEWKYYYQLNGYIRNGDTIGEIYHDSIFLLTDQKEIKFEGKLQVYPNPTSKTINIILPLAAEECKIVLTDLTGKVLVNKDYGQSSEITLDFSEFRKGIYLLKIQTGGKTYFRKIFKS